MNIAGPNEGLRVLDDFVCTAIPEPGLPTASQGVGTNAGVHVLVQMSEQAERLEGDDLKSHLRSLNVAQLHAYLRRRRETGSRRAINSS